MAREVFIRRGLVDGEFPKPPPEVRANQQLLEALRRRAERSRHPEIFNAEKLFAHFDKVIPKDICSADALRKWLKSVDAASSPRDAGTSFLLRKSDWWPAETAADRNFPDSLRIAGKTIRLAYRHSPDDPENDGITCTISKSDAEVLKLWRADWLVPGLLPEKLSWMLGTLPSALRRVLSPLNEAVEILLPLLKPGATSLEESVRTAVNERWGFRNPEDAWDWKRLPPHLQMRFRVRDDATGKTLVVSRNLEEVLSFLAEGARRPLPDDSARGGGISPPHATNWTFGDIPERQTDRNSGWETVSYPALHDEGDGVTLKLFADPATAAESHAAGVTRLFTLALEKSTTIPFRRSRIGFESALYLKDIDYSDSAIAADILAGAIRETLVRTRPEVRTAEEFEARLAEDRSAIVKVQSEMTAILVESAATATRLAGLLEDARIPAETADSVSTQLAWLLFRGFPRTVPLTTLRHYRRYLKGAQIRLERARLSSAADLKKEALFASYWEQYREALQTSQTAKHQTLQTYRWMLEEYRVSLFAQELHTPEPISPKRLGTKWAEITA